MKNKQLTDETANKSSNKSSFKMVALLLENFYSKEELLSKLNIKLPTLFKNIRLIKQSKLNLERENKKYKITSFANAVDFTSLNTSTMAHLLTLSYNIFPKCKTEDLFIILKKFLCLSSKQNYESFLQKYNFFKLVTLNNKYLNMAELLQKYINKKTTLRVTTKNKEEQILKPVDFIQKQEKIIFVFEDIAVQARKEISPENIIKMSPVENEKSADKKNGTIFELTGRLAHAYVLKENEEVLKITKNKITVINYSSDKQQLFKRLLRYDILCNVQFPKKDRTEFKNLIKKSLDNINKFQDNININEKSV